MGGRKITIASLLTALLVLLAGGVCQGAQVAVLPMEDLSQGANGVNLAVTEQVREGMARRGFAMLDNADIMAFMVKNRVRWLGYLDSRYVRRLHSQLEVEYLVLGSVNQRKDTPPLALGITLQVIRTADARIIWARSAEVCAADEIGLLGLSGSSDMAEMATMLLDKLLAELPAELNNCGPAEAVREGIDSVFLGPEIVKPGDMVQCRIRLTSSRERQFNAEVSLFVDERIIAAHYLEGENSYLASWPAAAKNGRYPVTVIVNSDDYPDREVLVGGYLVDGQAPVLELQIKGQELNGMVVLQKNIVIMPVLQNPEPINRWVMTVHDEDGAVIMGDDGRHGLPSRFSWWGQAKNGALVADGLYSIVLEVWDRAGNSASARQLIRVLRQQPEMVVAMREQKDSLALELAYDGEIPLAYWRLEVMNDKGQIISESNGTESMGSIHLSRAAIADQQISYRLYAQDMLGNRLRREVATLVPLVEKKEKDDGDFLAAMEAGKGDLRESWVEDF